jgi:hypothetical protein
MPFRLDCTINIVDSTGNNKAVVISKETEFTKCIEPLSCYQNIQTVYTHIERVFFKVDMQIVEISCDVCCVDASDMHIFASHYNNFHIEQRWVEFYDANNLTVWFSHRLENKRKEQILDELFDSYSEAQYVIKKQPVPIKLFLAATPSSVYDIVDYFPIEATNSIAVNDCIIILLDGREDIGISFSPHEFVHILINGYFGSNISGAGKAIIEGICEYASESYRLRHGWMSINFRARIGLSLAIKLYGDIEKMLSCSIAIDKGISIEYYLLMPSLIKYLVEIKVITIDEIVTIFLHEETISDGLSKILGNPSDSIKEWVDYIGANYIDTDIIEQVYQLYSRKHSLYQTLSKDSSVYDIDKIKTLDILFQKYMLTGRFSFADSILSNQSFNWRQA